MKKTNAVSADQLKSIIERIERLDIERQSITDDIKEVYNEAKANGFHKKVLRRIVALRKRDRGEVAEEEAILDLYLSALE